MDYVLLVLTFPFFGFLLNLAIVMIMLLVCGRTVSLVPALMKTVRSWRLGPPWVSVPLKWSLTAVTVTVPVILAAATPIALPIVLILSIFPHSRRWLRWAHGRVEEYEYRAKPQKAKPSGYAHSAGTPTPSWLRREMEDDPSYQELMRQYQDAYGDP